MRGRCHGTTVAAGGDRAGSSCAPVEDGSAGDARPEVAAEERRNSGDNCRVRLPSRLLVAAATALALIALAGCTGTAPSLPQAGPAESSTPVPIASAAADDVRVAVVGDSLTAGGGRSLADGLTQNTWISYAQGDGIAYAGGWAVGGRTVEQMAAGVKPIADVDVLVLMGGTNDVRLHRTFRQARASYDRIVATVHPEHVIIGAIPPYDRQPKAAAAYERQLSAYAIAKGWDFVDPWGFARDGLVYRSGTSRDGIHPTTAGYRTIGLAYRAAILRVTSVAQAG